jgi:hypothetical protein
MLHDLNDKGYTVKELYEQLGLAIKEGMGERRIYVGPENDEKIKAGPVALPITGIEGNTKEESESESEILWLYPGENEWR